jgi:Domain of unknown function (DUF1735)
MKRIHLIISGLAVAVLSGCLKDKPNTDFSGIGATAEISTASTNPTTNAPASGLAYFPAATISFSGTALDTITFTVNITGDYPPTKDVPVTLAIDPTALATYVAVAGNIQYTLFPDSTFSFPTKTATIKAGTRLATFSVVFDPSKVDPTGSYMLPITITQAGGITVSANLGTIFFHKLGNPIAGVYNVVGTRYNYTGVIGYTGGPIPAGYVSTAASPSPKSGLPIDTHTITLDYANLGGNGYQYLVTYDPTTPNTVAVVANATLAAAVSNFLVTVHTYDPATKTIHITSTYNNALGGAGSDRVIDEIFTHQ